MSEQGSWSPVPGWAVSGLGACVAAFGLCKETERREPVTSPGAGAGQQTGSAHTEHKTQRAPLLGLGAWPCALSPGPLGLIFLALEKDPPVCGARRAAHPPTHYGQ